MLTINIENNLKEKLQQQAENNGHTLEQEIVYILHQSLTENQEKPLNLADKIKQRFADLKDVKIPEIIRDKMRTPPDFNL